MKSLFMLFVAFWFIQPISKSQNNQDSIYMKVVGPGETGKFIPVKEAERRPKTTVVEKIKRGK